MSNRLIDLAGRLGGVRVLLAGDFMLDRYIFGRTERISPEAPIPILRYSREEQRLGGAGFVAVALATLGASVDAVGVVGTDAAGDAVLEQLAKLRVGCGGIIRIEGRPTVDKVRLLGASEDRSPQQMLRLDIEETAGIDDESAKSVIDRAAAAIAKADVVALEDYNKGVLTPAVCQTLIKAARAAGKPVLIDPARLDDYSKYAGATLLKLNRPEAEKSTRMRVRTPADCEAAARALCAKLRLDAVVITLNDQGSFLFTEAGGQMLSSRPRQVADATGAGDMVLATLSLAHAAGADWHDAVSLANVVAGLEVERLGCVPITKDEIVHDLMADHIAQAGKERSLDQLLVDVARLRAAGRRIVFTNGCFDLIHLGHVKYFQFAKAQGDVLIVGVNTDASIRRLKGPKRPVVSEDDRIGVLEELESIDLLVRFDDDTPLELIRAIRPDVLVKGADYKKEQVVGWDLVESHGGTVALAPLIDGRSTTNVIRRIIDAYGEAGDR